MHNNSTYVGLGEVVGWQLKPMDTSLGKKVLAITPRSDLYDVGQNRDTVLNKGFFGARC